ncbi:MAG TPA: aminopeptidase P family protein [Gemmatimonadales bacterium]|jgi:Xaa-Pro aminopeptidase
MSDRRAARQRTVAAALPGIGADALIVTHLPNIRWLTGFTGSAGVLVISEDHATLITDFRYETQAAAEVGGAATVLIERANLWDRLKRWFESTPPFSAVAYESHATTVRDAERLPTVVNRALVAAVELVEGFRQVKDDDEVAAIVAAAALAQESLAETIETIRPGDREIDIAARLESALRHRGSQWHPFQTIVASGPRSALPHARSSEKAIARGEFLLIDFGAQVDGYCSDITRTFAVGAPDGRQREIYEIVRQAQARAIAGLHSGLTGREGDALARDLIAARGHGPEFGHSLGHGLGLEVHEAPRLAVTAEAILPAGTVVTVEPGIYLAGWGGVRIEDDVWLTPEGGTLLSDGHTELIILDT